MPYPSQINRETIVETAVDLIEQHGVAWLSLAKLAKALGVKAPSLYRYVRNKNELLRAVNLRTSNALTVNLRDSALETSADPIEQLLHIATAYLAFAREHPALYRLVFNSPGDDLRPDEATLAAQAMQLQDLVVAITGEANSLAALRGLWAMLHGFVLLDLTDQMRRGGDLDAQFRQIIGAYLAGWG